MNRDQINVELEKALETLDPELRAKLNVFKNELMEITYTEGMSKDEFELKTKRLEEDFKLDIEKNGVKSNK